MNVGLRYKFYYHRTHVKCRLQVNKWCKRHSFKAHNTEMVFGGIFTAHGALTETHRAHKTIVRFFLLKKKIYPGGYSMPRSREERRRGSLPSAEATSHKKKYRLLDNVSNTQSGVHVQISCNYYIIYVNGNTHIHSLYTFHRTVRRGCHASVCMVSGNRTVCFDSTILAHISTYSLLSKARDKLLGRKPRRILFPPLSMKVFCEQPLTVCALHFPRSNPEHSGRTYVPSSIPLLATRTLFSCHGLMWHSNRHRVGRLCDPTGCFAAAAAAFVLESGRRRFCRPRRDGVRRT